MWLWFWECDYDFESRLWLWECDYYYESMIMIMRVWLWLWECDYDLRVDYNFDGSLGFW